MNDSQEYQKRLLDKLNILMGILKAAIHRINDQIDRSHADTKHLVRIRDNLKGTLKICARARSTLLERMEVSIKYPKPKEVSSIEEYQKFSMLPPITKDEIQKVDMVDLIERLQDA